MVKKIVILMTMGASVLLAGCGTTYEEAVAYKINSKSLCESNTGFVWGSDPKYTPDTYYSCQPKAEYCDRKCSSLISEAYGSLNDTWGNQGGFPESVNETLNKCLDTCNK